MRRFLGTKNRTLVLSLQGPNIGDERLDFVLAQFAAESLHRDFAVVLHPVPYGFRSFGIAELSLHLGIGKVFCLQGLAHGGVSLAVFSVTRNAVCLPIRPGIGR